MVNKKGTEGPGVNKKKNDKINKKHSDSRSDMLSGRGPVGLVIAKIIDVMLMVVHQILDFLWFGIVIPSFNFAWSLLFSEFNGIFAGKDKDGDCYNSSFLRYIITILLPPMGIFMSKGLSGWPSIGICSILTLFHIFPGIIYAFIVTYNNRYADRYQQRELDRINKAKLARSVDPEAGKYGIVPIMVSVILLLLFVYGFIRIARVMASMSKN